MSHVDLKAALFAALELEREGRDFYARAAQRVDDPKAAQRFAAMAQEELEHIRLLNFEHYNVAKRGSFVAFADAVASVEGREFEAPQVYPTLAGGEAACLVCGSLLGGDECDVCGAPARPKGADVDTLLDLAVEAEARSIAFYERLAEAVDDPEGKRFFARFVEMEREHLAKLQTSR